ncbi:MAG: hypothetical protein ABIQ93_04005, partial [Saprospiraceae bacterium]
NQAAYQELEMHQAFQQWFRESKPLFVLPRNEENPGGGQRIKTALAEKLGLSATEYDRIVCTGIEHPAYPTAVWIAQLQQAIAKYGARDRSVLATQLAQLTQLFDQRLVNILNQIGLAADRKSDLRAPLDYAFKDYLQEYKQAAAEQDEYLLRELGKIVGEEVEVFFENIEQGLGQQKGLKKYWDGFVRMVLHEGRLTEKEIRHLETELREAWNARLETLVPRWATSWEAEAVWLKTLPAGDFSPVRLQPGEAYEPDVDLSELLEKLPRLTKYGLLHKNERISVLQARLPQVLPTTGLPTLSNGSLLNTVADSVGSFIPSGKWAKVFISLFRQVNGVAQQAEKYSKRALATALVHRLADDTLRAYHASYGELSAQLQNRVRRYLEQYLNIKRERAEYENLQVLISQLHGTIGELKKLANRQHAYFYDTKD